MAVVSIIIDGQKYNLSCDDGQEERLTSIGRIMDKKSVTIRRAFPKISDNLLLVMVGVLLAEDVYAAKVETNPEYENTLEREERCAKALADISAKIEKLSALI